MEWVMFVLSVMLLVAGGCGIILAIGIIAEMNALAHFFRWQDHQDDL